ncbi:MAG: cold shock domain-containing protein [Acidobacteriota bacterium]
MTIHGEVVRLEPAYGFGFIRDDQRGDWFFLAAGVRSGGLASLWVGERVNFSQERSPNGPRATDIHNEVVA